MIKLKRIYEEYDEEDGYRILVDRLWPRGIKKEEANFDLWLKDIAPSNELRIWFNHDPAKWEDFKKKYGAELSNKKDFLNKIRRAEKENRVVTLLYGAKDSERNQAVVIAGMLEKNVRT
ncbi:MAG TPA: DUF488 domain-containing protein [Ignavibacteriales bacterium]|nr:DUF488 domain-containing protein [Ignavibacteriales bacterium]